MGNDAQQERQLSGVYSRRVGDILVTTINDGIHQISFDDIVGVDKKLCEAAHTGEYRSAPPWLTINTYLVRTGDKLVLIDSGFADETPFVGGLVPNLATLGVSPADIDTIVMTHMHPDHEAGLIDRDKRAVFPNAELVVHEAENAFWQDDAALARASEAGKGDFVRARDALAAYAGRVRQVGDDAEVAPGMRAVGTPGHTPGHTAWLVESGGDALLVWGDIVHLPGVQFALPEAGVVFDIDSKAAAKTRRRVLDMVAAEKLRVAGIHHDFPAFGHVKSAGEGFAFVSEAWTPIVA